MPDDNVRILHIGTERPKQALQTLEEQSDKGLHCLSFHLHLF